MSETDHVTPIPAPRPRRRWVWICAVVVPVLILVVGVAVVLRSMIRHAEKAKCALNLKQIGVTYRVYANAFGGATPPTPVEMIRQNDFPVLVFVCPANFNDDLVDAANKLNDASPAEQLAAFDDPSHRVVQYVLVRSLPAELSKWTPQHVVAFESIANHGNGMNVLFGDGHVEWLTSNGKDGPADKLVADHAAGVVPLIKR